jgi:HD domain
MPTPTRFLRAMGHALELRQREDADVTLRRAADEACVSMIYGLVLRDGRPVFRFTEDGVVYGSLPLAEFEDWIWSKRLAERGLARVEFSSGFDPAAVAAFLDVAGGWLPPDEVIPWLSEGGIHLIGENGDSDADGSESYPLPEELNVMRQAFAAAARGERLPLGDLHAVATSLGTLVYDDQLRALPLYHGGAREEYQPAHALNTALLSVVLSDSLGMGADERRECGLAALLHDIGMAYLPTETVNGDRFTNQDRARVLGHPLDGARLLLRYGDSLEGAAVVCYEHHLRVDGGGYPLLSYPREPHVLSRVVAVCDAFDALLAPRPDRESFDQASALLELERNTVTQFDPRIVSAFNDVMLRSARAGGLVLTMRRE